ncbi:MAG: PhoX family phosphatase [Hyphomicrobiales bacterium]
MSREEFAARAVRAELAEDEGRNESGNPTMGDVIARRYGRRDILKGALAAGAIAATVSPLALAAAEQAGYTHMFTFDFEEVAAGADETHHVAAGYDADILVRWGDPVFADAPEFDPQAQNARKQLRQFGYNNDFIGFIPLGGSADRGLLVINHEYTNEELMFPGVGVQHTSDAAFAKMTRELVDIEMAAHGGTVIEVARTDGKWSVVRDSRFNRRITPLTPMEITGPAAGHDRLKTSADPEGRNVLGMINNCAGGVTPWGTWLTCEENFHGYFRGRLSDGHREHANYRRYGVPGNWQSWGDVYARFAIDSEPNEANRFGWVVEIDPRDPASAPRKRTALGRFKHEGAGNIVNGDGRFVVYQGDDERFEYVYRFVTAGTVKDDPAANRDLLDSGTLCVARFGPDGKGRWLPLVHGQGPLTPENGFHGQADVVIEARRAADLLGATRMDRPEDVEANPRTGKVYVMLTNNTRRKDSEVDHANPRAKNAFGHIIELRPDGGDHASESFEWDVLLRCGDPSRGEVGATFSGATTQDGWFGMPDNCAVDNLGRLWIATDGNSAEKTGRTDGLWSLETEGEMRRTSRCFFRCPVGAELCGPCFTPDGETLFVSVQHPGESEDNTPSTFENPTTRWPDFTPGVPPRPSVVAITRKDGGQIG